MPSTSKETKEMNFLDHLKDLRKTLLISFYFLIASFIIAYIFYHEVVFFLARPFETLNNNIKINESNLFINSLLEAFFIKIKISLFTGAILSSPIHFSNILNFILPALKPKEKKIVFIFIGSSFLLIIFSFLFSYQKIIPLSISFLSSVGFIPDKVGLLLNYQSNIFFVLQFLIASLILFQFPIILNLLLLLNFVKLDFLVKKSRIIVILICVLSAIITPPDPISLISFALPLVALFYFSLLIAKFFNWGK